MSQLFSTVPPNVVGICIVHTFLAINLSVINSIKELILTVHIFSILPTVPSTVLVQVMYSTVQFILHGYHIERTTV